MSKLRFSQITPRDEETGEVEYAVYRGTVLLGSVERYAHASYRSTGRGSRIRGSKIGYFRAWRPLLPLAERPNVHLQCLVYESRFGKPPWKLRLAAFNAPGEETRTVAAALLEAWHDHPELREVEA